MIEINQRDCLKAILRSNLKYFAIKTFNEVSGNSHFLDNWHIDVICQYIEDILEGKNNRLIINIPPRYLKSIICSIALPAFILGHNPKASIISVSYSDELAQKLALDCRKVIESNWYQELFPRTKLYKSKKSINDFETTRGGGRYSTSINGTLTGRGADYIIIDDPIKPMDALSDIKREKTNDWYGNTLYSRLNDKKQGKIIVIMQRLHECDFTGHLLEVDSSYKHIKIPIIAEKDEIWELKNKTIIRKKGEALHPERDSLTQLNLTRDLVGEFTFAEQYQQNPIPREGGIIKKKWLQWFNKEQLNKDIESKKIKTASIVQSWDTANKVEKHNDYSACVTALRDTNGNTYILDIYREKLTFPDLIKKVTEKYKLTKEEYKHPVEVLIEDQASGTSLIQELKSNHNIYPKAIKPEYDKKQD